LEEINQCIQVENADLIRLLQVAENEKKKLRLVLEKNVEEQVGECSTIEEAESPSKIRPTCGHDMYISCGSCHESVDGCTYC
jgi:hypothetical protein